MKKTIINTQKVNKIKQVSHIILTILITSLLFFSCKREIDSAELKATTQMTERDILSLEEPSGFEKYKSLGGEVNILRVEDKFEGTFTQKIFYINAPTGGEFYISAWINSPALDEQKSRFSQMGISINAEKLELPFSVSKAGWHSGAYMDGAGNKIMIKLKQGANIIAFTCAAPLTPSVDFIRLARDKFNSDISEQAYTSYIEKIKKIKVDSRSNITLKSKVLNAQKMASMSTLSMSPDNPLYEYGMALGHEFNYSYYMKVYLTSGQSLSVTNYAGDLTHIMEIFSADYPGTHSWTSTSYLVGAAQRSWISFFAPVAGQYFIKLRSAFGNESGLGSLVVDAGSSGVSYYYDCPIINTMAFYSNQSLNQEYNYFTSHTTGDPLIWLNDATGSNQKVVGYNDDYVSSGDFNWGMNSRVKKNFNLWNMGYQVSAYSSYFPTGTTDLYVKCKNGETHSSSFPNLKADDAIMSSPQDYNYNCTAWTGGFTSFWFWGSTPTYSYGNPQVWSSWDDYYGNSPARYSGATTYTASGADESNATIAMWAKSNGEITHGSIRKPGNDQAHGYDWESKRGQASRIFHPRDALNGDVYGSIVRYYQIDNPTFAAQAGLTFEESIAKGLTKMEQVVLNSNDNALISAKRASLDKKTNTMAILYSDWMNEIKSDRYRVISDPYKLIESEKGRLLSQYAKTNLKEAILYFTDIIFENSNDKGFEQSVSSYMFCTLTANKYGKLMENIKEDWKKNPYTTDKKYIAPHPQTFTKKYVKAILAQL